VSELKERIEKLKKLREAADLPTVTYQEDSDAYTHILRGNGLMVQFCQDSSGTIERKARFIADAANDAIPLLEEAQSEIERLERQLEAAETALKKYRAVATSVKYGQYIFTADDYFAQSQKGSNE
jgi:hypothetical protein